METTQTMLACWRLKASVQSIGVATIVKASVQSIGVATIAQQSFSVLNSGITNPAPVC